MLLIGSLYVAQVDSVMHPPYTAMEPNHPNNTFEFREFCTKQEEIRKDSAQMRGLCKF